MEKHKMHCCVFTVKMVTPTPALSILFYFFFTPIWYSAYNSVIFYFPSLLGVESMNWYLFVNSLIMSLQQTLRLKFNPLNPELNPICYLLALLGTHHFLHVSRIRVKLLTFRRLMSYLYGAPILDVSRSHTTTQHSR